MKKLIVILALKVVGCAHPAPPQKPAAPRVNLALAFVHKVDADIPCEAYYTDVGEHHAHSVVCKLPSKQLVYCTISDETWPLCKPIDGSDAKPAPRGPEPPPPAKAIEPPPPVPPSTAKTKGK